jgi:redox-sensing transcriptional repressor
MMDSKDKAASVKTVQTVPKAVVGRLSLYLRELEHLRSQGLETTNSTHLGSRLGITDAQVRKDLTHFGQFGYPGVGYRCSELVERIKQILGTDRIWPIAVVGVGNLGRALLGYHGFESQGFRIAAAFDVDPGKVGSRVEGIAVHDLSDLEAVAREKDIHLAILAVPATAAQAVANLLAEAGIEGILNFAPLTINLPGQVSSVEVDLAIQMEQLSFAVVNREPKS